jgi:lipopolysaccharide export system protein LptA
VTANPVFSRRPRRAPRRAAIRVAVTLLAACAVAASPASWAEKADRDKPINFSGDTGDASLLAKGGTLVGNVIITQGTLTIRAERIVFKQNADNSLSATAFGNPVSFRQKRDGFDEYFEGFAQRAEYDGTKEFLELFDRALLRRGQDEIRSNYISYNTATELFKAEGRADAAPGADPGGPGARVRGVFQPKSDSPLPGKGRDAAKGAARTATPGAAPDVPPAALKPASELPADTGK